MACSEVLRSMAREKRWRETLSLFEEINARRDAGLLFHVWRPGQVVANVDTRLIQLVRHVRPDTVAFNICMHACDRHWEKALAVFFKLKQGLRPSVVSYGALCTALGNAHKWLQVLSLFQDLQPQSNMGVLCNTVLGAFKDAHRWDLALALSNELPDHLDHVGWETTIAACAKGSAWPMALALALGVRHQSSTQTYNWLLKGMRWQGHWQVGLALLQHAREKRVQMNQVSYSNLLHLWRLGRIFPSIES